MLLSLFPGGDSMPADVLGITELAALLDCPRMTVYRVITQDMTDATRPPKHGGAYIIDGERVQEFRDLVLDRQARAPWAKVKGGA